MEQPNKNQEYVQTHFQNVVPFIDIRYDCTPQIYISKNTLILLGSPDGVRVLFDKGNKTLALQASNLDDPDCFPVIGKAVARSGILRIGSVSLVSLIWDTMDWDKAFRYKILPKYYENENIATFNLLMAKKILIPKASIAQPNENN
jgi:hypothetical protein